MPQLYPHDQNRFVLAFTTKCPKHEQYLSWSLWQGSCHHCVTRTQKSADSDLLHSHAASLVGKWWRSKRTNILQGKQLDYWCPTNLLNSGKSHPPVMVRQELWRAFLIFFEKAVSRRLVPLQSPWKDCYSLNPVVGALWAGETWPLGVWGSLSRSDFET